MTNESISTEELKFGDGDLTIFGSEQNEPESANPLLPEYDNDTDYDYTPDDNSALQQLVSHVYLNNKINQVPNKASKSQVEPDKKLNNVRQQTKKATSTKTLTMARIKPVKKAAVIDTITKAVITSLKRQRPEKKSVTTGKSGTKTKLSSPFIKSVDKSKLRMKHKKSKDKNNRVIANDLSVDASQFETKFEDLESILFDILGLQTKFVEWKVIPFDYSVSFKIEFPSFNFVTDR